MKSETSPRTELNHLDQFEQLEADYRPGPTALDILATTPLVLLVSFSGGGRNAIIDHLQKGGRYHYAISDTTRQPRRNQGQIEQHGQHYWFYDEATMLARIKNRLLLEFAIIHRQQVSGLSAAELQRVDSKVAITDMDIQGCRRLLGYPNQITPLFILPPTPTVWQTRLQARGQLTPGELQRRQESAIKELDQASQLPELGWLINDDLATVADQIDDLVRRRADPRLTSQQVAVSRQAFTEFLEASRPKA